MAEHGSPEDQRSTSPRFETSDAPIRPFVAAGVVLMIILFASIVGVIVLFRVFNYYQPRFDDPVPPLADLRQAPQAPRLQIDPPRQKLELRQYEDDILTSYAWIDPANKQVRIPVQRAIELVSEGKLFLDAQPSTTP